TLRLWVRAADDAGRVAVAPSGAPRSDLANTFRVIFGSPRSWMSTDAESPDDGFVDWLTLGSTIWSPQLTSWARSGASAWFSSDPATPKDDSLVSPAFVLAPRSILEFWHTYSLERGYDGGTLEISTD